MLRVNVQRWLYGRSYALSVVTCGSGTPSSPLKKRRSTRAGDLA